MESEVFKSLWDSSENWINPSSELKLIWLLSDTYKPQWGSSDDHTSPGSVEQR